MSLLQHHTKLLFARVTLAGGPQSHRTILVLGLAIDPALWKLSCLSAIATESPFFMVNAVHFSSLPWQIHYYHCPLSVNLVALASSDTSSR